MTANISSSAARITVMNPPVSWSDFQAERAIHDNGAVDQQFPIRGHLEVDAVHRPGRRSKEVDGVAEVAAAVARALEAGERGVRPGRLLAGIGVPGDRGPGIDQVAGDVIEIARGAAKVGADQADRVEAVRVVIDDDPLVDEHGRRSHGVGGGGVRLEGRRVLVGRVRVDELETLVEGDRGGDRKADPTPDGHEAAPRYLAAVFHTTLKRGSHHTKGLWAGGVRIVAKMNVDAIMMMKSTATSRQPKSALIAASTPCTQSRIAKRAEAKHRVVALGRQRLPLAKVLVDQGHQRGMAPGQR